MFQPDLHQPIHSGVAWLTIAAVTLSSFLIITNVMAQTETITQPAQQQYAPPLSSDYTYSASPAGESNLQPSPSSVGESNPKPSSGSTSCAPGTICGSNQRMDSGPGGMGQQGPNEEEMSQRRMQDMKRGLNGFIKSMNGVRKQVTSFRQRGLAIPEELSSALAKVEEVAEKIKQAQTAEEIEDIPETVQEIAEVIQDWMPKLPRLMAIPRVVKQAEKEITKADKAYANDERKAKNSKIDLSAALSDFRSAIDKQRALLEEIKGQVQADPETALDRLQEDFFGEMDNLWNNDKTIQTLLNLQRGITQINRELKQAGITIKTLKRQKQDTIELESILAEANTKFIEVKSLVSAKPVDIDAVVEAIDDLMELKQSFYDQVEELTGQNDYAPQLPQSKQYQLNLPQGFGSENSSSGGLGSGASQMTGPSF